MRGEGREQGKKVKDKEERKEGKGKERKDEILNLLNGVQDSRVKGRKASYFKAEHSKGRLP